MYKRDLARKKICSEQACFTAQMMRNGISSVSWFTDMIALAIEAESGHDDIMKLRFIRHKMHQEVRDLAPSLKDDHMMYSYLREVRNAEDSIRKAILALSADDIMRFDARRRNPGIYIPERLRGQKLYLPATFYIPERFRGQQLYLPGGPPLYIHDKESDRDRLDIPTETPEPAVTQTPDELVHDAERQDDTLVAKIDDKDELILQQPDEAEIADLVKETPDDAHHDQLDNNTIGVAHEDSGTPNDKVRVGIDTTDDSQLQKQYERRHPGPMVIDGYRQVLTYINKAFKNHHWRVQGRIGIG